MKADLLPDEPSDLETRPDEPDAARDLDPSDLDPSDIEYEEMPCTDDGDEVVDDDARWDAFIPDDDERDPEPDSGDFWVENGGDSEIGRQGGKENDLAVGDPQVSKSLSLLV